MALIAGVCFGVGLLGGCGAGFGIASTPADPAAAAAPAVPTSASGRAASTEPSSGLSAKPSASLAAPSVTPSPTRRIVVPDVVGMNHQEAQDLLQSRGLYGLQERDASGQGRMLVWDRNWTVVRQSPKAGARVTVDEMITLYSKQIGE